MGRPTLRHDYRMSTATASGGPVVSSIPYRTEVGGKPVVVYAKYDGKGVEVTAVPQKIAQDLINNPKIGKVPAELEGIVEAFLKK